MTEPALAPHEAVDLPRRLSAEALGSFFLFVTVIGSGIMGETLAGGNVAIALLANTLATGAILIVLIAMLAPLSGAHFNPAVSLAFGLRGDLAWREFPLYAGAQLGGGMLGVWAAHAMFELPILQVAGTARSGGGQWLGEGIATFGLVLTILGTLRFRPQAVALSVGLFIAAGYWFTSSTSFANPAIAVARGFSDTFAGIAPGDVPAFIAAECAGAVLASVCAAWLFAGKDRAPA